jgi:hypothetical protein
MPANTFVAIIPDICKTDSHLWTLIDDALLSRLISGGGVKSDMMAVVE